MPGSITKPEHASRSLIDRLPLTPGWLREYQWSWLRPDLMAGVTVAAFAIPENMAYATLAGLPAQVGHYASIAAMLAYMVFGSSRQMSVGVTSALSILVAGTLATLAAGDPNRYLGLTGLTALVAGGIALAAGLFRLGFIVNFISRSVLAGFSAGAALYIAASQLLKLFGIAGVEGGFFPRVANVIANLDETNIAALSMGVAAIASLLVLERFARRLPGGLLVVVASIIAVSIFGLTDFGIEVLGEIPQGLPALGLPPVAFSDVSDVATLALACFLLSYVEGISVARTFAVRGNYRISANQELFANGAINAATGLVQGYPVGGSMSRSAVNEAAGARTPLAQGFAAGVLIIVILFFAGFFSNLAEPVLAAIVLVAVRRLIDVPELRRIMRISPVEFIAAMLTLAGILVFGMLEGVFIGAIFSVLVMIKRISFPTVSTLGRIPGTSLFGDIARHPENRQIPGVLVYRVNSPIFYANSSTVSEGILDSIKAAGPDVRLVVLDMEASPFLDVEGADALSELADHLKGRDTELRLAQTVGPVRDVMRESGIASKVGGVSSGVSISEVIDAWVADKSGNKAGNNTLA